MNSFSISTCAKTEIERIIRASGCHDPVITLCDSSSALDLSESDKLALLDRVSHGELEQARRLAESKVENVESWFLEVGAFERGDCRTEDLTEINGVALAMMVQMREALRDYCLTYIGGRFMLESADEVVFSLRSAKPLSGWFTW